MLELHCFPDFCLTDQGFVAHPAHRCHNLQAVQAQMDVVNLEAFAQLKTEDRSKVLKLPVMSHLQRRVWCDGQLWLHGAKALISQVNFWYSSHVQGAIRCEHRSWAPTLCILVVPAGAQTTPL